MKQSAWETVQCSYPECANTCTASRGGDRTVAPPRCKDHTLGALKAAEEITVLSRIRESAEASEKLEDDGGKFAALAPPVDLICQRGTIFRTLVEDACRGGDLTGNREWAVPPGLVIECILALASAVPRRDKMLDTRINRYTCLLAMSRAGKDVSWARAAAVLGLGEEPDGINWIEYNPGGHSQMIQKLGDTRPKREKGMPEPQPVPGPARMFGLSGELGALLKSAKSEGSHMYETFNQMYDRNRHTTREPNTHREVKMDCRFSWGTSLAIGLDRVEEGRFEKMFSDAVNDGFAQRFCFAFAEGAVRPKDLEEWHPRVPDGPVDSEEFRPEEQPGGTLYLDVLSRHAVTGWEPGVRERYVTENVDLYPGSGFQFKKTLVTMACVNLHEQATMQDFDAALAWLGWQAAIRETFRPSRADDRDQTRFNETILRATRREDQRLAAAGKKPTERWMNIQRMAERGGWAVARNTPLGLEKSVYGMRDYGHLALLPKEDDGDGLRHDWKHVRVPHAEKDCWCCKTHTAKPGQEQIKAAAKKAE